MDGTRPRIVRLLCHIALPLYLLAVTASASAESIAAGPDWHAFQEALAAGERHARWWRGGWAAFHAANLSRNLYRATASGSTATRFDGRVDSIRSSLALADLALRPPPHGAARAQAASLDPAQPDSGETALMLARATAGEESRRRAPAAQTSGFLVNAAAGGVIAIIDDRPGDGVTSFLLGMLVNTIQTRTQPTQMSRYLASRSGDNAAASVQGDLAIRWTPSSRGVTVRLSW